MPVPLPHQPVEHRGAPAGSEVSGGAAGGVRRGRRSHARVEICDRWTLGAHFFVLDQLANLDV